MFTFLQVSRCGKGKGTCDLTRPGPVCVPWTLAETAGREEQKVIPFALSKGTWCH
jgi:hypothetical protein